MNLLAFLAISTGRSPASLLALLERVAKLDPTVAPISQQWVDLLHTPLTTENITSVFAVIPAEAKDILRRLMSGQSLDSKDHPSDLA